MDNRIAAFLKVIDVYDISTGGGSASAIAGVMAAGLAATSGAARAIGREARIGTLAEGKQADIQIWDIPQF